MLERILRTRWLVRLPVHLYRAHLGFLLGSRMLCLQHRGRSSGQPRYVVLEVLERRHDPEAYVVICGLGPRSQWYRNVVADPRVQVFAGSRYAVSATAVRLPTTDVVGVLDHYAATRPRLYVRFATLLRGWADDGSEPDWRTRVPMFALTLDAGSA
ncbi:MAG: nitroreductase family deazaflavin-dependent oxidoreductase [Propionibacteriaceae bacterium]